MIYGLYLSGQGALVQQARQDIVANNLANANTTAFKRDMLLAQSHLTYDAAQGRPTWLPGSLDRLPGGVTPAGTHTDFSVGPITQTEGQFDLAIVGQGFFKVQDGRKTYLTRDGQLEIGAQGHLVTKDTGLTVLNTSGQPIGPIDPQVPIDISPDGFISQGNDEFGKMALVEPQSYDELTKSGKNLYATSGKLVPVRNPDVKQGYVEQSSVQPVASMVELITTSRALEANTNMIQYQDDSLGRLLASLPRK